MTDKRKTYSNAGAQAAQAHLEIRKYGSLADDDFITLKTVALVLGINRNKVCQLPVQFTLVDKRKVYRKGDVRAWLALDAQQPESLLQRLRGEQVFADEKKARQPSRRYVSAQLETGRSAEIERKTKQNAELLTRDELYMGWAGRKRRVLREKT